MGKILIFADGGARGNPGPAGIGAVIRYLDKKTKRQKEKEISKYIGNATNNQAEYRAIIAALETALKLKPAEVTLYLDSELAVRQLTGVYRMKSHSIKTLALEARKLIRKFPHLTIVHINGSENKEAHRLAQAALKRVG